MEGDKAYQLKELNDIMESLSELFSKVSRYIVVSLCSLMWLELLGLKEEEKSERIVLLVGILLIVVYFVVELLQYFMSFTIARSKMLGLYEGELTEKGVQASMFRLNKLTYRMACAKFVFLICIVVIVFIHFGVKLLGNG